MKWPWTRRHNASPGAPNGHAAKQAVADAEKVKQNAEKRWREVNKVADDFAAALENALRRQR